MAVLQEFLFFSELITNHVAAFAYFGLQKLSLMRQIC